MRVTQFYNNYMIYESRSHKKSLRLKRDELGSTQYDNAVSFAFACNCLDSSRLYQMIIIQINKL